MRSTDRLELDFMAKQTRWSTGASARVQLLEMVRQRALRIDVKRRAEFARQRLDGDAFAEQLVADVTKIVHDAVSLRFGGSKFKVRQIKNPPDENPAGG